MSHAPTVAGAYFLLQAVAVLLWWGGLAIHPPWRAPFVPHGAPEATLLAFAPPDLLLLVLGSAAAAVGRWRRRRWAAPLAAGVAGAALYATAYTVTLWLAGITPPLGAVLMLPSAVLSAWAALVLIRDASRSLSPG